MAILNLWPFGQFEFKRRQIVPEAPEPPPPSSPEDIFRYERAPWVPMRRDVSARSGSSSRAHEYRSLRLGTSSQPTNAYDEPPPYSLHAPEAHIPSLEAPEVLSLPLRDPARTRRHARKQSERYLIEIIALTVRADFDKLNDALSATEGNKGTISILSDDERQNLLSLSYVTFRAGERSAAGFPLTQRDEQTLRKAFVFPSALELDYISNYRDLVAKPGDWTQTVPGYWVKAHETTETSPKAEDSIRSLELLIHYVSEPDDVKSILMKALEATRIEMRLGVPDPHSISYPWDYPTRDGYVELKDRLTSFRTNVWSWGL